MKTRNGAIVALLLLATCSEEAQDPSPATVESAREALGKVPGSEVAVWQKVGSSTTPDLRYLQAAAFDPVRKVVVMFGGTNTNPSTGAMAAPNQETWTWNTTTGKWANRTGTGSAPAPRSGAAMVYDSKWDKMVLFGGRAGSGYNYEDTWEWDPKTGTWTDVTNAGSHPSARSQHGMAYEVSTGKILLFGGGRSDSNSYDGTGVVVSLGDTWELDAATHVWTAVTTTTTPTARHDLGLVWDPVHNKAILFGGMQMDVSGVTGIPKQDTWEFDPSNATWTERTSQGSKPGPRSAHSMAFDGNRNKVVVFGGLDISSGGSLNDVWDWEPTTRVWTQRMTGSEAGMPSTRRYASLVSDDDRKKLELVAGLADYNPYGGGTGGIIFIPPGGMYGTVGSREVWELDPAVPAFTDRTPPLDVPTARSNHCMAYYPTTGKVYLFGGYDQTTGLQLDDLWAWDGTTWSPIAADLRPPARADTALAYDPVRKSLILYGGNSNNGSINDTWEWTVAKGWSQLSPSTSPDPLYGHGMVTDTTRNKILLFGGMGTSYWMGGPDAGIPSGPPVYKNPMRNDVWEWDGAAMTWTNRTPITSSNTLAARQYPLMAYDEGQKKLFLYDGNNWGADMSVYWEWDPVSAGWAVHDTGDSSESGYAGLGIYDSIRRREVLLVQAYNSTTGNSNDETWELDANSMTWYVRSVSSPPTRYSSAMAFDSARGVVVLFGGQLNDGTIGNDTWEYKVTGLGNSEGCTAASASSCASGYCVDGVCCDAAACAGPCKACNVHGSEGTCAAVKAGTEVPGSCSNGQACDGSGKCMASNGKSCTSATDCASGFCVDQVCCDSACGGTCVACNQTGRVGKCSPFAAGTDPQNECGKGDGVCKSTCDGVSGCAYPQSSVPCDTCMACNGIGTCSSYDPYCSYNGSGGRPYPAGGSGGYSYPTGGSGGRPYPAGGSGGYPYPAGGSGGYTTARGGSGGTVTASGGYPYPLGGSGSYTTARGGSGGTVIGGSGGTPPRGTGGTTVLGGSSGFGGAPLGGGSGTTIATGGNIGQGGSTFALGGSGGKMDAGPAGSGGSRDGATPDMIDFITEARLHRSGCSCELGQATSDGSSLAAPLFVSALGLLLARFQRRRR